MNYLRLVSIGVACLALLSACGGDSKDQTHTLSTPLSAPPAPAPIIKTFSGPRDNYTVLKTATGFAVTEKLNIKTTTMVSATDVLKFSDKTINLHIGEKAQSISANELRDLLDLYIAFFNRVPDADGLAYWIDQYKAGMSLENISQSFYAAAQVYSAQTGYTANMTNADFVRLIYKNVLGRTGAYAPPEADVQYWASNLQKGTTRGSLVSTMLVSARSFTNDATWGWVPTLLNNKVELGKYFAVQQGINYATPEESISKTMAIVAAISATDTSTAKSLIGVSDQYFDLFEASRVATVADIKPSTVSYGTSSTGAAQSQIKSGTVSLSGSKEKDGSTEIVLDSGSSNIRLQSNAANTMSVLTDSETGIKIISETGPKGTVIRSYDKTQKYLSGVFIEIKSSTQRYQWQLKADGSTDPSNLINGKVFTPSDPFKPAPPQSQESAWSNFAPAPSSSCYEFIRGITGSGSDAASDIGDALDDVGDPTSKRVGRAAQYLSSLWKRIPQLCQDAPNQTTDAEFQRETVIEAIHAIDEGKLGDLAGKYLTYKDYLEQLKEKASQLRTAINQLPESIRKITGAASSSSTPVSSTVFSKDLNASLNTSSQVATPAKVYIGGSVSCVNGVSKAGSFFMINNCGYTIKLGWCFAGSTGGCSVRTYLTLLTAGQSYSITNSANNYLWYAACQSTYSGKDVYLNDGGGTYYYCSYLSH